MGQLLSDVPNALLQHFQHRLFQFRRSTVFLSSPVSYELLSWVRMSVALPFSNIISFYQLHCLVTQIFARAYPIYLGSPLSFCLFWKCCRLLRNFPVSARLWLLLYKILYFHLAYHWDFSSSSELVHFILLSSCDLSLPITNFSARLSSLHTGSLSFLPNSEYCIPPFHSPIHSPPPHFPFCSWLAIPLLVSSLPISTNWEIIR